MDEQLERIIIADEDARAHVAAARTAADERRSAAEAQCRRRREADRAAAREALDGELRHIQEIADRTVAARVAARAEYAEARRRAAEPSLAEAAGAYARVVREGAAPSRMT
jgi:hypothetical protein